MPEESDTRANYLKDSIALFERYKGLIEESVKRVDNDDFFKMIGEESNSIAIIIKHLAGNMRSRWRDFLISDGEKPDRHRDAEFEIGKDDTRQAIMKSWQGGWQYLAGALKPLTPEDLGRIVTIRGESHTVIEAIDRQLTHFAYHAGQIVFLARYFAGPRWESLSIPRGKSEEFNAKMRRGPK